MRLQLKQQSAKLSKIQMPINLNGEVLLKKRNLGIRIKDMKPGLWQGQNELHHIANPDSVSLNDKDSDISMNAAQPALTNALLDWKGLLCDGRKHDQDA